MTHVQLSSMRRATLDNGLPWMLLILFAVLVNALPYRKLVKIDDTYDSYRYAEHSLRHSQLSYNLGGERPEEQANEGELRIRLSGDGVALSRLDRVGHAMSDVVPLTSLTIGAS